MEKEKIESLLDQCEKARFWGTVRFVIQDGMVNLVEVSQTIKASGVDEIKDNPRAELSIFF